jgi:hypothetical protein
MKTISFKPGYEFIFTLSLLAILGLPPLVFAKSKDVQITISNSDTSVNGNNINDLSPENRKQSLKDIGNMTLINGDSETNGQRKIIIQNIKTDSVGRIGNSNITPDTKDKKNHIRFRHSNGKDSTFTF